ncbi:nuclear transport factor 2 family protein [Curtobacterium sp. ISL-83]|uniref:nuclear transport factor 2 family protein n=1 Tax=Curtobacterium sp. ISL-83 TaxID=2819145 RepID=UPI001BE6AB7D|nr:nuclear transport factor 2 family protein [Curtobacterium sp. ISL-83]MBT2503452.1 nuclear transport factor 2 family protein [Curtobacterium sp. ISL-83]
MLTTQDRLDISETLALYAAIVDTNQLDRLDDLFEADAVYDMTATASGIGAIEGIEAIRAAAGRLAASEHAPLAHFVTNIIATSDGDARATAQSRGLMIMADGSIQAVSHDDELRRRDGRWRIGRRVITPLGVPTAGAVDHR